jgi:hypothetical protein
MPAAGAGKTQFVRPPIDSAPPNGQGWDIIHPNASAEENELVSKAAGVSTFADFPDLGIRTNFIAQKEGKSAPRREDFMMNNEPANVQVMFPRIVINFGSSDKGTAGQVSIINGRVDTKKGAALHDPNALRLAGQHACLALCLNIARQEGNMPYALARLQEMQNQKVLSDKSGQAIGSQPTLQKK